MDEWGPVANLRENRRTGGEKRNPMRFCYNIFNGVSMKTFGVRDLYSPWRESKISNRRLGIGTVTAGVLVRPIEQEVPCAT